MSQNRKSVEKTVFVQWYYNSSPMSSLFPSKAWDEKMADPVVRTAIANSREVKKICQQTEAQIVKNYTNFLDFNFRQAFQKINRHDLSEPSGFADSSRASPELKNFFECRKMFERLIADDITQHSEKSAQLSAYSRWISIARLLFKKHNYDAFWLVLTRLSQIDMRIKLSQELPERTKKSLDSLEQIVSFDKNFKVMRRYIREHHSKNDLPPVFLWSKDMTFLNEVLGNDKHLNPDDLPKTHHSYKNLIRKKAMLDQLFDSTKHADLQCSPHLESMYQQLRENYLEQIVSGQEDNLPALISRRKNTSVSMQSESEMTVSSESLTESDSTKATNTENVTPQVEQQPTNPKHYSKSRFNLSFFSNIETYTKEIIQVVSPYLNF